MQYVIQFKIHTMFDSNSFQMCVPKYSLASQIELEVLDIDDHILLPTQDVVDDTDDFVSKSGKVSYV